MVIQSWRKLQVLCGICSFGMKVPKFWEFFFKMTDSVVYIKI